MDSADMKVNSNTWVRDVDDLNDQMLDMNQDMSEMNRNMSDMNRTISDMNRMMSDMSRDISDMRQEISDMKRESSDTNRQIEALNAWFDDSDRRRRRRLQSSNGEMPRDADAVNRAVRAWTPKKPSAHAAKLPRTFKSACRRKSTFLRGLEHGAPSAIYCGDVDFVGWMLSYFFEALMTIPSIADVLWRACRALSVDSICQVAEDWEAYIEGLLQNG